MQVWLVLGECCEAGGRWRHRRRSRVLTCRKPEIAQKDNKVEISSIVRRKKDAQWRKETGSEGDGGEHLASAIPP